MIGIEVVDMEGKNRRWILEEEMAKIIKTGVAIGYNFNGKDKDKAKEVIRGKFVEKKERSNSRICFRCRMKGRFTLLLPLPHEGVIHDRPNRDQGVAFAAASSVAVASAAAAVAITSAAAAASAAAASS
ncbi:hypothetical protein LWI29_011609 [Acer saccharum]|uniref:Uncharacterized protein n=1 Tax=Acer saccharum TaxID=4024 RepID=A0AA39SCZ9_ACESA|nr:hypothetical protein LWI29_011609 [Acer saccharum]